MVHVPKHKNISIYLAEFSKGLSKFLANFFSLQSLGRNLPPIGEVTWRVAPLFILVATSNRFQDMDVLFPSPHTRLVHRNLNQPGAEPRLSAKLADVLKRFQRGLLCHILSVRLVAQKGKRREVHAPFIGLNELVKQIILAIPTAPDQGFFVAHRI